MDLIETIGVAFGLVCVVLTVRQNIWCWPTGLVNVTLFMIMFYKARLYADMGLQAVYIVLSIYGWYQWLHGGPEKGELPVSQIGLKLFVNLMLIGISGTLLMGWALANYTNADLPYWDSTTTVMSLIAQWMLAKKILENWLVWISADVLFIGIYFYKELYLTGLLYVIFLILATSGFILWKKSFVKQLSLEPA
ncbi:MAG: nicotinamide mononucleotide transporter [Deltaproteobacteria bacterium]|nr:nicotinamide mononucleotide transporter [Deltaproteobacteria bacterium]